MLTALEISALEKAIQEQTFVSVAYNRGRSILAPFLIFVENGGDYLRAVTIARDGAEPTRFKFGSSS